MDEGLVYELLKRLYARLDALERRVERLELMNSSIQHKNKNYSNFDAIDDDLYEEAKKVVVKSGTASASILQRRLRIGYARAARLLDILEENGVIGPAEGAKPRDIL